MSVRQVPPGAALAMLGFIGVLIAWLVALLYTIFSSSRPGRTSMGVDERILFALSVLVLLGWIGFELLFRAAAAS